MLLKSLERSTKGPEIIVSRADTMLVKRLFEMEVPEIFNGAVEIVSIAREPGSRSKVAVRARQDGVDPVGSCVGLRGVRIQSIVNELMGEKIDVVEWSKEPARLIANALSPAQVLRVELDSEGTVRGGRGAGEASFTGYRQRGPERPAGCATDLVGHRHTEQRGGRCAARGSEGTGRTGRSYWRPVPWRTLKPWPFRRGS